VLLKYIGACDSVDVPDFGIFGWKQGEVREIGDEVAKKLLVGQAIFEEVKREKEEKVRGDK